MLPNRCHRHFDTMFFLPAQQECLAKIRRCEEMLVDNHSSLFVIISNTIFINIHTDTNTYTHTSATSALSSELSLVCSSKRQQSLYSAFSFDAGRSVGRMGLVFSHCIVKKEERQKRKTVSPDAEHALTHTVILSVLLLLLLLRRRLSRWDSARPMLHNESTMIIINSGSDSRIILSPGTIRSRSQQEVDAYRVENFIERDDEPALGVLALRILFLHITCELVLLAR